MSDKSAVDDLQDRLVKLLWHKVTLKNKAETGVIVTNHLRQRPVETLVMFGLSGVWTAAI